MTRFGYYALVGLLALASVGAFGAAVFAFSSTSSSNPTPLACDDLAASDLPEGPVRVTGCSPNVALFLTDSTGSYASVALEESANRVFWATDDPDYVGAIHRLLELDERSAPPGAFARFARRHEELRRPRVIEGRLEVMDYANASFAAGYDEVPDTTLYEIVSLPETSWGIYPLLYGFVFALLLALLMRKQRRWEAERVRWEREQGIVIEGEAAPRGF